MENSTSPKMEIFLGELASRKWRYYQVLYKRNPQAVNKTECFDRINLLAKYEEVLEIINDLPPEESIIVNNKFDEIMGFFGD